MTSRRAGFTLIEVMVGLTIGALVILLAHRLVQEVQAASAVLTADSRTLSREQNGRQLLADLLQSVDLSGGSGSFTGGPNQLSFGARAQRAEGWFAPQRVGIAQNGATVVLTLGSKALVIRDSVKVIEFDYLMSLGGDSPWYREWTTTAQAPLAVRLRLTSLRQGEVPDTLLFLVRGAG
jgi:prepilin-type N-terminal cleavage/methylation domain-containing protein